MILSVGSGGSIGTAATAAVVSLACYAWVALRPAPQAEGPVRWVLWLGWLAQGAALAAPMLGSAGGLRLGFAPVLSLTIWLLVAMHGIESRLLPLPQVQRALALAGMAGVLLALAFPGDVHTAASSWAPLHYLLGVGSYGLFGAAVLHGLLLDTADRRMRRHDMAAAGPLGLPLLRLERLTFGFVLAGFAALSAAVLLGVATAARWRWDHKTVLSLLSWAVFAALLAGRWRLGWRGRRATRWLYAGALLLLLAYAGSRFVFEVLLGRQPG